jgi:hypothetical protein
VNVKVIIGLHRIVFERTPEQVPAIVSTHNYRRFKGFSGSWVEVF